MDLLGKGAATFKAGDYVGSERLFRQALEAGADEATCRLHLARIYNQQAEWAKALDQWRWFRDRDAETVEPHLQIARALLQLKRHDEARVGFEAVLVLAPDHAEARRRLEQVAGMSRDSTANAIQEAQSAFKAGEYGQSEQLFARALAAGADEAMCRSHLARIYNQIGDWSKALEQWRWLRDRDAGNVEPQLQIARALLRLSRHDEARAGFEAVLALAPDHAEARQRIEQVVRMSRASTTKLIQEARSAFKAGDYGQSEQLFARALAAGADEAVCRSHLARIYNQTGDWSKALEQWRWLRERDAGNVEPQLQIARALFSLADYEGASAEFRAVLGISPGHPEASQALNKIEFCAASPGPWDGPVSTDVSGIRVAPITVAIATFNRAAYLRDALTSCRNQVVWAEKVIVIDDGSDDGTAQVVGEFHDLPIEYVNVGKIGLGNARNLATALCRSKYICILDDDDIMLPNRLSDHLSSFAAGARLSYGGWINFDSRLELEFRPGKRHVDEDLMVYAGGALTHGACCYETAVLREFPYRTDGMGGADYDFALRAIRADIKCRHTGSYVLLRRRHATSISALHGRRQASMRDALVGAIDFTRTVADIADRTAAARRHGELLSIPGPALEQVFGLLGGLRQAMCVTGAISRSASSLFALLDKLGLDWTGIGLVDASATLTPTVDLRCSPTMDTAELSRFERALRRHQIKPSIVPQSAQCSRSAAFSDKVPVAPGEFRVAMKSSSLRELGRAFEALRHQRRWEWVVVACDETDAASHLYWLVSAPFKHGDAAIASPEGLCDLIRDLTSITAISIDGGTYP